MIQILKTCYTSLHYESPTPMLVKYFLGLFPSAIALEVVTSCIHFKDPLPLSFRSHSLIDVLFNL
jgi:hypothetical protein